MRRYGYFLLAHFLGLCVASAAPLSAQKDMAEHPLEAVAPETFGAVALGEGLPSVPELVEAHGLQEEGSAILETWRDSWALESRDGAVLRAREVYPGVVARLFPLLSRPGVRELLLENEESLRSAKRMGILLDNEKVEWALAEALRFHQAALLALQEGDGEMALGLALQSADALREVSPREVASDLLQQAQDLLGRKPGLDTYSIEEVARIRRLTHGAREALEEGDYPRAIRRAYYACRLMGVEPG